jgi:hypothetical protein
MKLNSLTLPNPNAGMGKVVVPLVFFMNARKPKINKEVKMKKRIYFSLLLLCIAFSPLIVNAQSARQTGVIKGIIVDSSGDPVVGMLVSAESPALLGTVTSRTDLEGAFRLANLPTGTYTIIAEMDGFKTVKQPGVKVSVGRTYTISLVTDLSTIEEVITVTASPPVVDIASTKVDTILTTELIHDLPLNRNLVNILHTIPGSSGNIDTYSGSIHGGASTTVTFEMDGVNNNSPTHYGMLVKPQYDSMEEIEITTGGLPAQVGNTGGSFVNVVTKSGGNTLHGQVQAYYTSEDLSQNLFPDEDLKAMGLGIPVLPIYDLDVSASLGGPLIKNKLWYFGTLSVLKTEYHSRFLPTTINGVYYDQYADPQTQNELFFKLTTQFSKDLRFFAMFNGRLLNRDVAWGGGDRRAYDSTFSLKKNTWVATTANLTWYLSDNTHVDVRSGYTNRWYPIEGKAETRNDIGYYDRYTYYVYGSILDQESFITRRTLQASAALTHFKDNFLSGNHEIKVGLEYQMGMDRYGMARGNPLAMDVWDGDVYSSRRANNITTTHPTQGDGRISLSTAGPNNGDTTKDLPSDRISAYLQDSWTVKNRLTINLGFRWDYINGRFGGGKSTGPDPSGLAYAVGEQLKSQLGYNPYGSMELGIMKDLFVFSSLSPRLGLTYDLFGDGKTALKASWSRYYEPVPVMRFARAQPGIGANYGFYWFDTNNDRVVDASDTFTPRYGWGQFNPADIDYLRSTLDPDLHPPYYNEATLSITHELAKNFAIKVQYLNKRGYDQWGDGLYDRTSGNYWYSLENAQSGWWVPYTTTVPAHGQFPEQSVTVYAMSQDAPYTEQFYRSFNNPDSYIKYSSFEVSFDKRHANGWALGGSVVFSSHKSRNTWDPNDYRFDNYDGYSVPLAIKLFGSFHLPFGFMGSFFYQHTEGTPYARTVNIILPDDFVAANNLYWTNVDSQIEPSGDRRYRSNDNVDLRLEKQFKFKFGSLALFVDIFNLLGNKYVDVGQNPGGTYDANTGTFTPGYNYGRITGVTGTRTYKFSIRFTF